MKTKCILTSLIVLLLMIACNPKEKPIVTTNSVTDVTYKSVVVEANVESDGGAEVTDRGVCWSVTQNPTISNEHKNNGAGLGIYVTQIDNLENATKYYVKAYATNSEGTSYGEEISFETLEVIDDDDDNDGEDDGDDDGNDDGNDDLELPNIKITKIRDVTENSAICEVELLSDGGGAIIEKGVCYSKDSNPTISDNVVKDESGENIFIANITDLEDGVKYNVRAYAINEKGISYGMVRNFTTIRIPEMPTIQTSSVSDITTLSALCEGKLIDLGGSNFVSKGFCWSTSQNPTIEDSCLVFIHPYPEKYKETISNLEENTTYYVRAYITTEMGTSYGEEITFKTVDVEYENGYITIDGVENYKMIPVEPGTFLRGYQNKDPEAPHYYASVAFDESPIHYVTLTTPYHIGETEVTQDLWYIVMGNKRPVWCEGERFPVDMAPWGWVMDFIERLNELTGTEFRLPTEAEWEFASIGGNESKGYIYSGSDNPDDVAWYNIEGVIGRAIKEVKTKMPNELGLYDMHGNVFEYCSDNYDYYSAFVSEEYQTIVDPVGVDYDRWGKVYRGGRALNSDPRDFLSRYRTGYGYEEFHMTEFYKGFRLAL